jgi:2-polyprenyl-6-methoxyphenol hydroxylase-like FAD-dependent oxidoreductase
VHRSRAGGNHQRWGCQRTTLLGDAAHAITPWVGQGAGISVEDAYDLAYRLRGCGGNGNCDGDPTQALRHYESARIPRAALMRQQANLSGALFTATNPMLIGARNLFYRAISGRPRVIRRSMRHILEFDEPSSPLVVEEGHE